ncbi:MAG: hypothetical protein AAGA58_05740 [Verrucomicrobiota bacterium]
MGIPKTGRARLATALSYLMWVMMISAASSQGPLNPPTTSGPAVGPSPPLNGSGDPQAGMKTLGQIGPRVPISESGAISDPGSYYLANNIAVTSGNGIVIQARNVSLDLNGFTISSTANPAGGTGILIDSGSDQVSIQNGFVRGEVTYSGGVSGSFSGSGFANGIATAGIANLQGIRVSDVTISGVSGIGINFQTSELAETTYIVEGCIVRTAGGTGIRGAVVRDCIVRECGTLGVNAINVSHCSAHTTDSSTSTSTAITGLLVFNSLATSPDQGIQSFRKATNCRGIGTGQIGINGSVLLNCDGQSNSSIAIGGGLVTNCRGTSNFGSGISAFNVTNSYGENQAEFIFGGTTWGIDTDTALNCYGRSTLGDGGLRASATASFSTGRRNGGTAISADNPMACTVDGTGTVISPIATWGTP